MTAQLATKNVGITALADEIDALAVEAMAEWKVPGVALVVVQNSETALVRAYGQRDVEADLPVTPQTSFSICSITKTFTATALALLVDEGTLDWSKPVRDYVPEFRLHDSFASDRVTVRDLLCHHSGLPRHDWLWMPADLSRSEMMTAMRHLESSIDVRTAFQYNNLAYNVASIVAERITGRSFEDFLRTRLTDKLGLPVTFSVEERDAAGDVASPYVIKDDVRQRAKYWPISTVAAGAINTSIAAIANWLKFLLAQGEFGGQRLLSAALVREMQLPRVFSSTSEFAEYSDWHYGLGFGSATYRGRRIVAHSGGWIGYSTLLSLMPERNLGVAVFTNRGGNPLPTMLVNRIYDHANADEPVPWLDRFRTMRRNALKQQESDKQKGRPRKLNTVPSHPLADYAGAYEHPAYGRMTITHGEQGLLWSWRGMASVLSHRHYDTFELPEIVDDLHPDHLMISFATDRDGDIASLSAKLETLVPDIVFVRAASGDCIDPDFRFACAGEYVRGDSIHVVAMDTKGLLTLKIPFQPLYQLQPYQGATFSIVGLDGFRVEFRRGPTNAVSEIVYNQPNGVFSALRSDKNLKR